MTSGSGWVGGMSWESTAVYYRLINQAVSERLGGLHSAKIILYSVDFDEVERLQSEARWDEAGSLLAEAASWLERVRLQVVQFDRRRIAPGSIRRLHLRRRGVDFRLGRPRLYERL